MSAPRDVLRRRALVSRRLAASGRSSWRRGRPVEPAAEGDAPLAGRRWSSRQLHRLGALASHAWTGVVVLAVVVAWVGYGAATGFPTYWQTVLESATSVITVVMLFAIQHMQARDQTVTQRKLDELLRASPGADARLIAVEEAPDEELDALTELNRRDRWDP